MAEDTAIEWATHTWSPWTGCTRVSAACDHCYAETWAKRTGHPELWQGERRRTSAAYWQKPIKWEREAATSGERPRIFPSLCDPFDNQVPERWRDDFWHRIEQTPHLDWLLLTKRPQNIAKMLPDPRIGTKPWGEGWPNVWLGTTTENQEEADRRIPLLLDTPAAVRFISAEPLLGPVDLSCIEIPVSGTPGLKTIKFSALRGGVPGIAQHLDWVIAGGESGPGARPMHPDWARSLSDQCQAAGVPFFFKQWGEFAPEGHPDRAWLIRRSDGVAEARPTPTWVQATPSPLSDTCYVYRVGKKAAGRLLDGKEHSEFPA